MGRWKPYPPRVIDYISPRISPDGQRIAVQIRSFMGSDIWVYDVSRGTSTLLTLEKGRSQNPVWTPDGRRITFQRGEEGDIYWMPADGSGPAERLTTVSSARPISWSRDGRVLAFVQWVGEGNNDIWVLPFGRGASTFYPVAVR